MDTVPGGGGRAPVPLEGKHGNVYYGGTTMPGLDIAIFLLYDIDMWPFKCPKQLSPGGNGELSKRILEELETARQFFERLELAEKDITNINTALQRIERKQNRWVEILNDKESPDKVAQLEGLVRQESRQELQVGEETL